MSRAVSRCPRCGERVSPFAAGCAICGADLEAARSARGSVRWPPIPRFAAGAGRGQIDWIHIAIAAVLAVAAPPIGALLAVYWAVQRYRSGEMVMAAAMLGALVLAVAVLLDPAFFWSRLL